MSRTDLDLDLLRRVADALATAECYGCPVCGGDCSSANPPVMGCPMQGYHQALTDLRALISRLDEPQDREAGVVGTWQPFEVDLILANPPEYVPVELDAPAPQAVDAETAGLVERLRNDQSACQDMADTLRNALQDEAADTIITLSARATAAAAARDEAVRQGEEFYARGYGLRCRVVDYLNSTASKESLRTGFVEWEGASGTRFIATPAALRANTGGQSDGILG